MESNYHVRHHVKRPPKSLVEMIGHFTAATVHEASGGKGALPKEIKPLSGSMHLCGPAVTVQARPGDNLIIHKAIYVAGPEDVLVIDSGGSLEAGYWGGIMTAAARERRIRGIVINGEVRDASEIVEMNFPVFCTGLSIRGTSKRLPGLINHPIYIGNVVIDPGDIVLGDRDGVVVIPRRDAEKICRKCESRTKKEQAIVESLKAGKTTLEIYGFDQTLRKVKLTEEPGEKRNG